MGSNPLEPQFFLGFIWNCLSYFITAKISFTSIRQITVRSPLPTPPPLPEQTLNRQLSQNKYWIGGFRYTLQNKHQIGSCLYTSWNQHWTGNLSKLSNGDAFIHLAIALHTCELLSDIALLSMELRWPTQSIPRNV